MSMKLVASIALLIPLLHPALTVALTNDQCAAGCDVNSAGETIARPVPACPDADGKTTKMNGIEYTL